MSKDQAPTPPEEFQIPQIRFVAEQDGPPERRLKEQLVSAFGRGRCVLRAYLARAEYNTEINVVLALRADSGSEKALAQDVGSIFASMFGANQYLDIVFLSDSNESQLRQVCTPFFDSRESRAGE